MRACMCIGVVLELCDLNTAPTALALLYTFGLVKMVFKLGLDDGRPWLTGSLADMRRVWLRRREHRRSER